MMAHRSRSRSSSRAPFPSTGLALVFILGAAACSSSPKGNAGEKTTEQEAAAGPTPAEQCDELASALGSSGATAGDVCRVTFARSDLEVRLLGATLPPGMGLTSWAAFGSAGDRGAIVMGDLALTSGELPAVMSGLRENGIRVTAVHRHMLGESPTTSYMHYLGIGPADSLARSLARALERAPSARGGRAEGVEGPPGPPAAARTGRAGVVAGIPCDTLARILSTDPADAASGPGYCKVSRPRDDLDVSVDGIPVPASLGIGSWFAFRETASGDSAVVTGDMALTQDRVNPAIAVLRNAGIEIVSLHNHMLFDDPRVTFFHFQARGAPKGLAEGLRSGLEAAGLAGGG